MPVDQLKADAEPAVTKFPLKVHHRDQKGHFLGKSPYTMYVKNGVQYFERPVGSGNLFYENMESAGRIERIKGKDGKSITAKFDFEAAHKEYIAPLSGDQLMQIELAEARKKSEALELELAAIKAERDGKDLAKMPEKAKDVLIPSETKETQDEAPQAAAVEAKTEAKPIPQLRKP